MFVGIETLLLIARAVVAVLFGHAIYALREEYGESTVTVQEANELQQAIDALASELTRVQQGCQQHIEQQVNLLNARQLTTLAAARQELETTLASSLTPERLMARLAGHLETLVQERLTVSLADMRQTGLPAVSSETPETRTIRLLSPQNVLGRTVRIGAASLPTSNGSPAFPKRRCTAWSNGITGSTRSTQPQRCVRLRRSATKP